MMAVLLHLFSFALAIVVVGLWVVSILRAVCESSRREVWRRLEAKYMHIVVTQLLFQSRSLEFPTGVRNGSRGVLLEVLAQIARTTYGIDRDVFRRIVASSGVEPYLLRKIALSSGNRRALYLSRAVLLPISEGTLQSVRLYQRDDDRQCRFYASLVDVANSPQLALRIVAECCHRLSPLEIGEVVMLLRRGVLPMAYQPLLASKSLNLKLLGLCMVRQFSIEEAMPHLALILKSGAKGRLAWEAIYTLIALHAEVDEECSEGCPEGQLGGDYLYCALAAMSPFERGALYRHLAREGYSAQVLRRFLSREEALYFRSIVDSYKSRIGYAVS